MAKKVLIIDDVAEVRDLLRAILESHDYQTITAVNGKEALEKVRQELPDLIIVDVLMPEMDGFVFLKELKKEQALSKIPVVVLTARAKMADSFHAFGVDGFLVKPINADEMVSTVNALILSTVNPLIRSPASPSENKIQKKADASFSQQFFQDNEDNATRKALIFGSDDHVLQEMSSYLHRRELAVEIVKDEKQIIRKIAELKPNLILLQIRLDAPIPLDELVFSITTMIKERAQNPYLEAYNPQVLIYKVEQEMLGVASVAEDMVEVENLIDRCRNNGNAFYIGLYSAVSFGSKIQEFLG